MQKQRIWYAVIYIWTDSGLLIPVQMREIAEIELAIQGGTEKIETFGEKPSLFI
jgi:hypothetical protein